MMVPSRYLPATGQVRHMDEIDMRIWNHMVMGPCRLCGAPSLNSPPSGSKKNVYLLLSQNPSWIRYPDGGSSCTYRKSSYFRIRAREISHSSNSRNAEPRRGSNAMNISSFVTITQHNRGHHSLHTKGADEAPATYMLS